MANIPALVETSLKPKLSAKIAAAASDTARSHVVVEHYLQQVLRPLCADPSHYDGRLSDGKNDGGLDGWGFDSDDQTSPLVLVQAKWYDHDGVKLSPAESSELLEFVKNRLVPNLRAGLNQDVIEFMGKYQGRVENRSRKFLVYLTNGIFDPATPPLYAALGSGWELKVLDLDRLCLEWYYTLSKDEPVTASTVIGLIEGSYFLSEIKGSAGDYPEAHKIRILQCRLAATDLRSAFDDWHKKLLIRNLRYGLGANTVNNGMKETAESTRRHYFYAFHNGISLVCEKFELLDFSKIGDASPAAILEAYPFVDPRHYLSIAQLKNNGTRTAAYLEKFQIVNGGQSTTTIGSVDPKFLSDITLPCKISETISKELAMDIAVYNNTQTKIGPEDLIAIDPDQIFLQNYAAVEVRPPVFYAKKRGEKWGDLFRVVAATPPKERQTSYKQTYQSFLSFCGNPIGAYAQTAKFTDPTSAVYLEITSEADKDLLLMCGILPNLESSAQGAKDPDFTQYWTQWVIACLGHVYRSLPVSDQTKLRDKLLGKEGPKHWAKIRKVFISWVADVFRAYYPNLKGVEYQQFFKGTSDVFDLNAVKLVVSARDVQRWVNPKVKGADLAALAASLDSRNYSVSYPEVRFTVFALLGEKVLQVNQPLDKDLKGIASI